MWVLNRICPGVLWGCCVYRLVPEKDPGVRCMEAWILHGEGRDFCHVSLPRPVPQGPRRSPAELLSLCTCVPDV